MKCHDWSIIRGYTEQMAELNVCEEVRGSMQRVNDGKTTLCEWIHVQDEAVRCVHVGLPCLSVGCPVWTYRVCWLCLMAAVRGRSACITHSSLLPLTTVSVGMAREWRLGTSLVSVASDCLALARWKNRCNQLENKLTTSTILERFLSLQVSLFLSEFVNFFHCFICCMCANEQMLSYVSRALQNVSEFLQTYEFPSGIFMCCCFMKNAVVWNLLVQLLKALKAQQEAKYQ